MSDQYQKPLPRASDSRTLCALPGQANPGEDGLLSFEVYKRGDWAHYKALAAEAVAGMRSYLKASADDRLSALRDILFRIAQVQNEHEKQEWGSVRVIYSQDLLVVENALCCVVSSHEAPF
jgi:hypothetical protein